MIMKDLAILWGRLDSSIIAVSYLNLYQRHVMTNNAYDSFILLLKSAIHHENINITR